MIFDDLDEEKMVKGVSSYGNGHQDEEENKYSDDPNYLRVANRSKANSRSDVSDNEIAEEHQKDEEELERESNEDNIRKMPTDNFTVKSTLKS